MKPSENIEMIAVLGAGGVGKTTSAAALGFAMAEDGRRVAVITVDPAKRLAQVLGLQALSNDAQRVRDFPNGGMLDALWLDTKTALSELIQKHSSRLAENTPKIFSHRLFDVIQSQLGGIEEYLGVEKIVSLAESGKYDLLILDTPPSRHALDFLESPRNLLRFFDEGVLKVFISDDGGKQTNMFTKLLSATKNQALDLFKKFLGATFLSELASLLSALKPVHRIFVQTAETIEAWVASPQTKFLIVSVPEAYPCDEARLLQKELELRLRKSAHLFLLNRCMPDGVLDIDVVAKHLGQDVANRLASEIRGEAALKNAMPDSLAKLKRVDIPREFSVALSVEQLIRIGRKIKSAWQP